MIVPTIGRVVWYHPDSFSADAGFAPSPCCAALVAHVHDDSSVNLAVFDGHGNSHSRTYVPLVQDGDERPAGHWCEWMPYQKGQAAKTEEAERRAGSAPLVGASYLRDGSNF